MACNNTMHTHGMRDHEIGGRLTSVCEICPIVENSMLIADLNEISQVTCSTRQKHVRSQWNLNEISTPGLSDRPGEWSAKIFVWSESQ